MAELTQLSTQTSIKLNSSITVSLNLESMMLQLKLTLLELKQATIRFHILDILKEHLKCSQP
jgi:hypothetical protein